MLEETGKPPNQYTKDMGELIKKAREESGLNQAQLAEKIYRKKMAVSEMENGKVEISAWTLPFLAQALNKPISYFFPPNAKRNLQPENLSELEQELLIHFLNIWDEHLQRVAIEQVKVIADFDPHGMIRELIDIETNEKERQQQIKNYLEKKCKPKGFSG